MGQGAVMEETGNEELLIVIEDSVSFRYKT